MKISKPSISLDLKNGKYLPTSITTEDSTYQYTMNMALFSQAYAEKIVTAVENGGSSGNSLKGYNVLDTISEQINTSQNNSGITVDKEKSYAEMVLINNEYFIFDFSIYLKRTSASSTTLKAVNIQLDNPTEFIYSGHKHYCDMYRYGDDDVDPNPTSINQYYYPPAVYFDAELNKFVLEIQKSTIQTPYNALICGAIPIFKNLLPKA